MRLPVANPARPVQSLGREDPYGPMRVANAQVRAAQYEGAGLKALGAAASEVGALLKQRADEAAVQEYNNALLLAQAEAERAMGVLEEPMMSVSTPGLDELDFKRTRSVLGPNGTPEEVELEKVPTYEVGGPWLAQRLDAIRDSALENLTDGRAKRKFTSTWALYSAKAHVQASGALRKQRKEAMRGGLELNVTRFVRAGDEENAKAAVHQGVSSGILTGTEGAEKLLDVESQVDAQVASDLIAQADSPAQLLELVDMLEAGALPAPEGGFRPSRMTPDELWEVRQRANAKLSQTDRQKDRIHEEGGREASELFVSGRLTQGALQEMLAEDRIDAGRAVSLSNALRARAREGRGPTERSAPGAVEASRRAIRNIRWTQGGTDRVSEQRDTVMERLYLMANGVSQDGKERLPGGPILSAADYQTLVKELDNEFTRIDGDPRYKQAVDTLRAVTGVVTDPTDPLAPAVVASRAAYDTGRRALDDYMDRYGAEADPVQWMRDQRDMFDPKRFEENSLAKFISRHAPEIAPFLPEGVTPEQATPQAAKEALALALTNRKLTEERAKIAYDLLMGADVPLEAESEASREYVQ